ncbi:DNA mismatch repair protein C-terminal [Penicillium longicatenatum]|uniref:DNA mismatch repair protein C-terminal n=1 Tax=Penicillium longicatenatum TaxID=1561947 RepID=UPI002547E75F|nr:DNA mismatch repair protein C-terminal [Penicillium longicatenatum]KAJ5630352.1 DNA mismatch repair protein C-terminal [Penicillium longicatenatum]
MPIEALPPATVRAIGSTSVISDPCSVVKELIDNSLDAGSSSVMIEISSNTVDVIQLKDNGHGIPTEDHPYVCRHTYTSKIQTLDDLKNVGGMSFGFRGEALASVAEMSGCITITTRIASEIIGSSLKYERDGQLSQRSQPASHPVGTTLRIAHFLKHIPVRRQVVLKSATKILTKIKKLVQAYAIAQPSKRFSLKVLKAKNENQNWMYAPSTDATLSDAAVKTFGRELSSCCVIRELSAGSSSLQSDPNKDGYGVVAFLPGPDSDISKINNSGQFISVDGRPLSATAGIGQDIAKLFKSYIRAIASKHAVTRSVTDPFLCLQLSCPRGSYDVNIEPGKDDVLFEDRDVVVSIIEDLFNEHYGPLGDSRPKSSVKDKSSRTKKSDQFDIMLARRPLTEVSTKSTQMIEKPSQSAVIQGAPYSEAQSQTATWSASQSSQEPLMRSVESRKPRSVNPWSVTGMNASLRTPRRDLAPQSKSPELGWVESSPGDIRPTKSRRNSQPSPPESPELTSPSLSRLVSTSPTNQRRQSQARQPQSPPIETNSTSNSRKAARQRDKERYGNGALDTWFTRTTQVSLGEDSVVTAQEEAIPTISQLACERFGAQSNDIESGNTVGKENSGREDHVLEHHLPSPSQTDQHTGEAGYQGSMDSGRGFPVLERWAANLREDFNPDKDSEVERALDFERRKKEAIQNYRARQATNNTLPSSQASSHGPHHNRYMKAKAALASDRPFAPETEYNSCFPLNDPREYLIRQNARGLPKDNTKIRHVPSSKLPFEHIPEGYDIHDLGLSLSTDLLHVKKAFTLMATHDSYTHDGKEDKLSASAVESQAPAWNARINTMIKKKYEAKEARTADLKIDFSTFIDHLKLFDA